MTKEQMKKVVKYWQKIAEHDYETMLWLFKGKRYSDALFYGHIILEKILKGFVVQKTKKEAPYTHDLVWLQDLANLDFTEDRKRFLNKVNDFNIRARYQEYKLRFYKICTKEYTEEYFKQIIQLYKELCQKLKQKK